jgi:hypothetical protein
VSDCAPDAPPVEEFEGEQLLVPPIPGEATLVTRASAEPPVLTARRDCDAVTALKRGLKDYLEQVFIDVAGARVRFQKVNSTWAEPEEKAVYPAAAILVGGEAEYDYSSLTPSLDPKRKVILGTEPAGMSSYLIKYAEVTVDLIIQVFTSSPEERIQVAMLLEDALNPVDWMYGFKIDLPFYFNQRAVYEPVTTQFLDSEEDARKRYRPGSLALKGQVSLLRVRSLPRLDPRASVVVETPNP